MTRDEMAGPGGGGGGGLAGDALLEAMDVKTGKLKWRCPNMVAAIPGYFQPRGTWYLVPAQAV